MYCINSTIIVRNSTMSLCTTSMDQVSVRLLMIHCGKPWPWHSRLGLLLREAGPYASTAIWPTTRALDRPTGFNGGHLGPTSGPFGTADNWQARASHQSVANLKGTSTRWLQAACHAKSQVIVNNRRSVCALSLRLAQTASHLIHYFDPSPRVHECSLS